jgi:hypothetical protein
MPLTKANPAENGGALEIGLPGGTTNLAFTRTNKQFQALDIAILDGGALSAIPAMTEGELVKRIKEHIAKGDQATEKAEHATKKAEEHYKSAGQHLLTLKAEHKGNTAEWEQLLKEKCGIGKSRAYELIRIANGKTTVEEIRADKAESVRKVRAAIPLRSGKTEVTVTDEPPRSWKIIAIAKDGKQYGSGVRLQTEAEVDAYRAVHVLGDFWRHRVLITATLAIPTDDEPTVSMGKNKDGRVSNTLIFNHGDCVLLGWSELAPALTSPPTIAPPVEPAPAIAPPPADDAYPDLPDFLKRTAAAL